MFNRWFKKESPILGMLGLGGGVGGNLVSGLNFEAGQVEFTTPGPYTWVAPVSYTHLRAHET